MLPVVDTGRNDYDSILYDKTARFLHNETREWTFCSCERYLRRHDQ